MEGLRIQGRLAKLTEVQICQLHDLEVTVLVHPQVQAIQPIEVVVSQSCLCAQCRSECE